MGLISTIKKFCPDTQVSKKEVYKALHTINRDIRVLEQAGVDTKRVAEIRGELPVLIALAVFEHQRYCIGEMFCQKCHANCGIMLRGHYCESFAKHIRRVWTDDMVRIFDARRVSIMVNGKKKQVRAYNVTISGSDYEFVTDREGESRKAHKIIEEDV